MCIFANKKKGLEIMNKHYNMGLIHMAYDAGETQNDRGH